MSGTSRGFTLIELMVVAAIVAIIAAVGYPSYLSHVRKTARAEAKVRLLQVAQLQERNFTEKNTYVTDIGPLLGLGVGATVYSNSTNDAGSKYQITVAAGSTGVIATSYTLSAVPQGGQVGDTDCGTLLLQHTGKKEIYMGSSTATKCWN
jgi:type IV pilus assembly protein PilE